MLAIYLLLSPRTLPLISPNEGRKKEKKNPHTDPKLLAGITVQPHVVEQSEPEAGVEKQVETGSQGETVWISCTVFFN